MNPPSNIKEPFRRELWDLWANSFLGEFVEGKKLGYRRLSDMVRRAEFLDVEGKMKEIRESVFYRFHVNWL